VLSRTILARRSARQFQRDAMTRDQLASLLGTSYAPALETGNVAFCDPGRLATFIAVARVRDVPAGLYLYDPVKAELRCMRTGDVSEECGYICLGQDLGSQAAAVIFHIADLPSTLDAYGDRGYRYLGLDAGHLGQRLNLAALRLGLGASGIGGYFDDHVNALFKLPASMATIYITCVGVQADRQRG
jgi:SagB-type dehydrogenase family enzyme